MPFEDLKVPELKELLKERGLKVSGKKSELIERLEADDTNDFTRTDMKSHVLN